MANTRAANDKKWEEFANELLSLRGKANELAKEHARAKSEYYRAKAKAEATLAARHLLGAQLPTV
jgi:hypothetical protein